MPPPGGPQRGGFKKPKNTKKTLTRLMGYFKPYTGRLILVFLFILLSTAAGVAGTYMLKPILNDYILPLTTQQTPDFLPLMRVLTLMAGIYLAGTLLQYAYTRVMITVSTGMLFSLRQEMFTRMLKLPIRYFDTHTHGEVMSRYTNDTDAMREMLSQGFVSFLSSGARIVAVFVMMLVLSPLLTLVTVAMLVVILFVVRALGKRSAKYFRERQQQIGVTNGFIEEMIVGAKVVKVFSRERKVREEFQTLNTGLMKSSVNASFWSIVLMPIMNNLAHMHYAITAAAGATLAIYGLMDLGGIASFLNYCRNFTMPITQLSQQMNAVLSALAGAERIFELMDEAPEEDEGSITLIHANKNAEGALEESDTHTGIWAWKAGDGTLTRVLGNVRLDHVTFSYDGETTVLNDVSLYAKPGQKIAFVGSTGAGKTTITNLLNRFYDVQQGEITYDGIPIKAIKKSDLRRALSMVLQDTHLFTGSVRENIRYGRLNATDAEVEEAAKLANAHSFITHLPQGYETVLTEDGANLSQGQRQLLAIARAAVANPPVLILDEATSSIDTRTEALIERGMDRLMQNRTVFVIAHRLSTVRNANAIMVLEKGAVIERGDHEELLTQQGRYYDLYTGMFELS